MPVELPSRNIISLKSTPYQRGYLIFISDIDNLSLQNIYTEKLQKQIKYFYLNASLKLKD